MMDDNTLLSQTLETSKKLHESGKQSWYSGIVFNLEELDVNLNMGIDEVKNKLIKRSMENWEKQVKEMQLLNMESNKHIIPLSQNSKKKFTSSLSKIGMKKMFHSI